MSPRLGQSRSPDGAEVARIIMDAVSAGLFVGRPGKIEVYNPLTQTASIKPLLKNTIIDEEGREETEELPIINEVPVLFPRGGGFFASLPLKKGDNVLLLFMDRSIDLYMSSTGNIDIDPIDLRQHDISDAVAISGFGPLPKAIKEDVSTNAIFGQDLGGVQVRVTPTGTVEINFASEAGMSAMLGEVFQAFWDAALTGFQALLQKHVHLSAAPGSATGPSIDPSTLLPITYPKFPAAAKSKKLKVSSLGEST